MGEHNGILRAEEIAMRTALKQSAQPTQIDVFRSYFGLSIPDMVALKPEIVPCYCGCMGGAKVQLNGAMHLTIRGPELTERQIAIAEPKAPEPDQAEPAS
jgi:hypothetical protein